MSPQAGMNEQVVEDLDEVADSVLAGSRAMVAVSARSIAGAKGVTLPQYRMLVVLDAASSNLTELAHHLDVAPSTAMRMVDRLVTAGLIAREVRPENRRETLLSLTASGRRTVRSVTARRRRDLRAVVSQIPVSQRGELARAMAAFAAAAEQLWPTSTAQ
jgi:DNA-binding MarR family transcriptional regulator